MNAPSTFLPSLPRVSLEHGLRSLHAAGVDTTALHARLEASDGGVPWNEVAAALDSLTLTEAQERQFAESFVREHPLLWLTGVLRLNPRGFATLLARALGAMHPLCFAGEARAGAKLELRVELRPGLAPCPLWWRLLERVVTLAPLAVQHEPLTLERSHASERRLVASWLVPALDTPRSVEATRLLEALALVMPLFAGLDGPEQRVSEVLRLQRELELTRAEARVAVCITDGLTAREASVELGVSYETVRTHLRNINARFELSSQRELVALIERWRVLRGR